MPPSIGKIPAALLVLPTRCGGEKESEELMKIFLKLVTEMEFDSEEKLIAYTQSQECELSTGFPEEILEAYREKKRVHWKTVRLEHAAVTSSYLEVNNYSVEVI